MAIALRAAGTWSATTGNITVTIPTGTVSGDLMVMYYGTKPYNDAPTINNSWIDGGAATDGTVAAGIDTGSMQARIFYKIHTGTETNPTVTNATNNVSSAVIVSFSKDATKNWELVLGGGGNGTSNINFAATTSNNISLTTNDWVAFFNCHPTDAISLSYFTPTLQSSGITFALAVGAPSVFFQTASGGDMVSAAGYQTVTSGTNTATITLNVSMSAASTGSMYLIRMREITPAVGESFDPFGRLGFFGL
jgi:hypothetical protein